MTAGIGPPAQQATARRQTTGYQPQTAASTVYVRSRGQEIKHLHPTHASGRETRRPYAPAHSCHKDKHRAERKSGSWRRSSVSCFSDSRVRPRRYFRESFPLSTSPKRHPLIPHLRGNQGRILLPYKESPSITEHDTPITQRQTCFSALLYERQTLAHLRTRHRRSDSSPNVMRT